MEARINHSSAGRQRFAGALATGLCGLAGFTWFGLASAKAQTLQDYFTNRVSISSAHGQINTNNANATVELAEPKHAGKTGGHSLWITWIAPTNGVVKFETGGSPFDTLLGAYRFASTNDTTFDKLITVAEADDSEGFERESEIEFGVQAGQHYEIAVDGYYGATGAIELNWDFQPTAIAPPVIVSTPADRSVKIGDAVTLTVALTNLVSAQFKWFFNGNEVGVTSTNLVITSFQVTNVGRYKLRLDVSGERYFAMSTEIQINSDGATNAIARNKVLDTPDSPLIGTNSGGSSLRKVLGAQPMGANATPAAVVRGYNGSQIFNTTYATVDTNEPPHCGFSGGVSYWLVYQPPTNGTLILTTAGSSYDTVMEAYTYDGVLYNYTNLTSIACDHNSLGGTNGASRVQFAVVKSRQYVVAVQGVNNAKGTAYLNYALNTNQLPTPPSLLASPKTVTVAQGSPASLAPSLAGAPPLRFSWKKGTNLLAGCTTSSIFFPSTALADTADYVVTVTNDLGSLSATLPLHVVVPTISSLIRVSNYLQLTFPTVSGQRYTVEEATSVLGPWQPWSNFYFGDGQPITLFLGGGGTKFFRIRTE
ncbi:MAG: hypothetical protein EPO07_02560 [Verrucomicrobia bacterium]|nr:MAG: hypothetical protein EPO07_02560 [Verrucomicrobiota bacterium]